MEPPPPASGPAGPHGAGAKKKGVVIGLLAALGLLLLKGKGLLLLLLGKAKLILGLFKLKSLFVVLKTGGSMFLMIGVYAMMWPVSFALGFVLLILVHELGHAVALRAMGIPFSAPIFIPFVGALIGMKKMPPDAAKEALVAFAGPFAGTVAAQVCLVAFVHTDAPVYLGLAQLGYMINLFNLAPYSPLDGGRIVGAISPKIWIVALPLMLVAGLYLHSLILLLITVLGVPRAIAAWRKAPETQAYYQVSRGARLTALLGYLGLAAFLAYMMYHVKTVAPASVPF
jgi:Zn-dependent protease